MKTVTVILASALGLAGCHAHRSKQTPPAAPAPDVSPATAKAGKSLEKSRDAMLGKNMDVGSQHWATNPAAASTATTSATTSGTPTPSAMPKAGGH